MTLRPDHFKELNWLPVEDRIQQLNSTTVCKILQELFPNHVSGYFLYVRDFHGMSMRAGVANLKQPNLKNRVGRGTFLYSGEDKWNKNQWKKWMLSWLV